ncbi:FAD-binding oxidoreductase [Sanyastnella coralliicola]|uniref:FAD-binding oxidoreductase n=1 Tax=Sanyastnella coralliicola TaxID=3069118 RepID=UPI0027B96B2D|nr:FAD-linked oxidase C-terminal domain-containing protein [Longitalea sp. SCSIO 12813]
MYTKISETHLRSISSIVGEQHCHSSLDQREAYGRDETEDLSFPPEAVVTPANTEEVSKVMAYCFEQGIPVTPIGGQTGLSGGALSVYGGVGLSLKRLNQILEIDTKNLQVITQPAVIVEELQNACAEHALLYAPDPASRGTCWIGGNLAENSGGPRAVKYGVTKDWVLNLEVVLPNGEVMETGANTLKNSTGYNLTQLMVGSEGTLGVITRATLKLIPKPKRNMLLLVPFASSVDACSAVSAIFRAGITPSALEFMERAAIELAMEFTGSHELELADDTEAHLLIEVDGNHEQILMSDCETIMTVVEEHGAGEVLFAEDQAQKDKLWFLRRRVGEAVKAKSIYKEEDTVVPRYALPVLLHGIKKIGLTIGFQSVCYGHAGDGNLHVNILKGDMSNELWDKELPSAIRSIFELVVSLGGTLSGEHGIGLVQKDYMDIAFKPNVLDLMWETKKVFDPKLIMNPGKVFPSHYWKGNII